ncbi:hypothetical protein McanCB56680_005851 [Microsporum canis]
MYFSHLHTLCACVVFILLRQGVHAEDTISSTSTLSHSSKPTKSIDFASALNVEASVAAQLRQLANIPAIPIPDDISDIPEYEIVRRLAPAMPPIQAGVNLPEAQEMIAQYLSSINNGETAKTGANSLLGRNQGGLKVMIAGDSMTQGVEGDWTWRYRMWQWFKENGISVQFVGPHTGTVPPQKPIQPQPPLLYGTTPAPVPYSASGGYAKGVDPAFLSNCNHFAIWGRAAAVSKGLVKAAVEQNPADLMLIMLGFNDMGWFYSDAFGTIDSIGTMVNNARSVNPNMKFAIATVPHRSYIGGRDDLIENTNIYNNLLPGYVAQWRTSQSPVFLVDLANNYDCHPGGCPAGYDGLHPNAWGEYQIANAFSRTLVGDFKLGSKPLDVPSASDPSLIRDLPTPSNFQVFSSPQGVTATWDPVYGAHMYDITVTINGGPNAFSATTSQFNRWDSQWPIDGWTYAVSVRASAGDTIKGQYTETKSAVAKPQLAPAPNNIFVKSTDSGFTVTWDPPSGPYTDSIVEYNVIYWDWNADHCQFISGAAFKSSPATITSLSPGVNYLIAVVTWNKNGQGFPFIGHNAVPGAKKPGIPSGLLIEPQDQSSVRLTWSPSDSAGGYHIWSRNIHGTDKLKIIANVTESTCNEEYFLFPGVWNYAFALSAFNGNDESEVGPEKVAPSATIAPGKGTGPKCPAKEPWCPEGGSVSVPPGSPTPTKTFPGGGLPTNTNVPIVTGGHCAGPDCKSSQCTDILCASLGCSGVDCYRGHCIGRRCIPQGCIGPGCRNGVCIGLSCVNKGCIGPDCDPNDHQHCIGRRCIGIDCIGPDCGGNGICFGPKCSVVTCTGLNCFNGRCIGPGCHPAGGQPGGSAEAPRPDPEEPDGCTTRTLSACNTHCTYSSTTSSCTSTCSDVEVCTVATDKSTATTETFTCPPSTPATNTWIPNDPHGVPPRLGAGGILGTIISTPAGGLPPRPPSTDHPLPPTSTTSTTTKTTTTNHDPDPPKTSKKTNLPLPTNPPDLTPYCFREHNQDNRWSAFMEAEATDVLDRLCDIAESLPPSNTFGHAIRSSGGLLASVTWARDQAGCSPKADLPLHEYCAGAFRIILDECDMFNREEAYGGAFVDDSMQGCVIWWLGKEPMNSLVEGNPESRFGNLTGLEKEEFQKLLAVLEPTLPRLGWNE